MLGYDSPAPLRLRVNEELDGDARRRFEALVLRRAAREPLQHVVGHWPFLELELQVDARALVPRPETEELALAARARLAEERPTRALDVGCGGGAIALALAAARPRCRVVALDLDGRALELARENRARLGLEERVALVRGALVEALAPEGRFDLVVANLPYIDPSEREALEPEVRDHDPPQALFADEGGLALIRRLVGAAGPLLAAGGTLIVELAPAQARLVAQWFREAGFDEVVVLDDRCGLSRFVRGRRP